MRNSLVQYLFENNDVSTIKYFLFAKKCEPEVTKVSNSWYDELRDTIKMKNLIQEGLSEYETCGSNYLKLRYGYQIVRLAHYTGEYERGVELYDSLVADSEVNSIIKYWALSHKAGCLRYLDRKGEAMYEFARVFDKCPSRQDVAKKSFRIYADNDLEKALQFCTSAEDSIAVWWLTGLNYRQHILKSMEEIYKLDPKSRYLEMLLMREIRYSEYRLLPDKDYFHPMSIETTSTDSLRFKFLAEVCSNNNTDSPYLWNYAAGYFSTLTQNPESAFEYYRKANTLWPENDQLNADRLRILKIISSIDTAKIIDEKFENNFVGNLTWLREIKSGYNPKLSYLEDKPYAEDAYKYVLQKLANKYLDQQDTIRYHLCLGVGRYWNYSLLSSPRQQPIDDLIAIQEKPDKSKYEEFLCGNYDYSRNELLDIKGTLFLADNELEKAVEIFKVSGGHYSFRADPFSITVNDCRDCIFKKYKGRHIPYNKLTFTEELIKLEKLKDEDTAHAAIHYFKLANAYYNMTHFGNSSEVIDYNRDFEISFYYWYSKKAVNGLWQPEDEYVDCSRSEGYYQKAMQLTNDKEFSAKCCFMAGKCEQNRFYITLEKEKNKNDYRTFFNKLYKDYSDTKYYKEVIKECKYFFHYVDGLNKNSVKK
jgi:hypothetical protein